MRQINFIFRLIAPLCIGVVSFACGAVPPAAVEPQSAPGNGVETPATPMVPRADVLKQVYISAPGNRSPSGLVTFTDDNNLMAIDIPGDWSYEHGTSDHFYYDTFISPAGDANMENLVYNDDTSFDSSRSRELALTILNTFYSSTGKNGDITITDDAIQSNGSVRLTWESKSGGYSGVTFFEIRENDKKTLLMFTALWINDVDQDTLDVINNAIPSYHIP